jgi:hypothetical protein
MAPLMLCCALLVAEAPVDTAPAPDVAEPAPEAGVAARWAAGSALGVMTGMGAVTAATLGLASGGLMLALLPALFLGNPLGCACLLGVFLPAQLVVLGANTLLVPWLVAPVAYSAARVKGQRRVPLLPLLAGVAVPSMIGAALAVVMTLVGTVLNCACLCCTYAGFLSFLQDQYHWQGDKAEYYIVRRVSPAVLYAGFAATQVLVLLSMLAGTGMSTAMVGLLTLKSSRESQPGDPWAPDLVAPQDEAL